nr:hypothetical protein [Paraburkholderia eburnea]
MSEVDKGELWEKDRLRQLADDTAAFVRHFHPNWDLRTITGEKALRDVQAFARDSLNLAHWNLPSDNAAVKKLLTDAAASGRLVPVVNREYRGLPRVAQPNAAPQRWAAPIGGGGYGYAPKVLNAWEFDALRRANGELPALDSGGSVVNATLAPRPALGVPATADDGFGLPGFVESAAGALLGGGKDDDSNGDDDGMFSDNIFSADSDGASTPLGDAQPFEYGGEDVGPSGDALQTAWLPSKGGPPNQWVENSSGKQQWRLYDGDGNAAVDIDFGHDHGFGSPHSHNWDNGVRDSGNAFSLLPY